jgi:hypothetical protein
MDALGDDGPELAGVGVDPAERQPVGDAALAALDTLAGDAALDVRAVGADFDEPLREEVGTATVTDVVSGETPQVADVHLPGVVDADPRAVVELVYVRRHGR